MNTRNAALLLTATLTGATALGLASLPAQAAVATGTVYIIQGVDATTMALSVDGTSIAAAAAAKTVVGPLTLSAGKHTLSAKDASGTATVEVQITVPAAASLDAIVHRQVDPSKPPVLTTFTNDLTPVAAGSARLTVTHTAAVGPADIRVKGKVLFSNVANGESLTLTVPAGIYPVDIVPTATSGPTVFGPVDLPVKANRLTRVFAIGVAATGSMDAVVQVLPLAVRGSGTAPTNVNAGDGGQAETLIGEQSESGNTGQTALGVALLGAGAAFFASCWRRRRTAAS